MSEHVDFFIEHIGSLEDSAAVVGATLLNNMVLCAPFSKHNTSEIVKKINDSRRYSVQCLDALVNIVHVSNTCLRSNQKKVLDSLCRAQFKSLLQRQYLVESEEGFALVKKRCEYLHEQAISGSGAWDEGKVENRVDHIDFEVETNKMCFHVRLLQLLAYCCEGEVATIEAQSQSLYAYKNLIKLLLSRPVQQVWPLRVALCALFKNMYLITETKKNGLATCEEMHKLIENVCVTLERVNWEDFQTDVAFSFEAQDFGLQVNILRGFQQPTSEQFEPRKTDTWWSPVGFLLPHVYSNLLPIILHYVQKYRLEFLSEFNPISLRLKSALERLYEKSVRSKHARIEFFRIYIRHCLEALRKLPFQIASPEISRQRRDKIRQVIPSIRKSISSRKTAKNFSILDGKGDSKQDLSGPVGGRSTQQHKQILSAKTERMILNAKSRTGSKWDLFLSQLDQEEIVHYLKAKNHSELMAVFKSLSPKGDLSLANILERIVTLIRNKVRTIREHNYYSRKIDKTTIRLATDAVNFLTFLMSDNHNKNDELEKNFWRDQISSVGSMLLVLDLVAIDIPKDLTRAALDFGAALLEVKGGNTAVQRQAYVYLSNGESEPFFFAVENMLLRSAEDIRSLGHAPVYIASAGKSTIVSRKSMQERWSMQRSNSKLRHEADALDRVNENSISLRVIEFLQLLCEGNFSQNQSILLAQPKNQVSKNILATITLYLTSVIKNLISSGLRSARDQNRKTGYEIGKQIYELLVDAVQGPCLQNQAFLACETELLEATNTLLRTFGSQNSGKPEKNEMEQKKNEMEQQVYVLLLSLIEGRDDTVVHEKITSMVKFKEVFRRLMEILDNKKSADMQPLLYSIVTLLFHLRDHNDEWFQHNLKTSQRQSHGKYQRKQWLLTQERMCDVEIYWMGKLHRIHFAIPHLCDHISQKRLADMEQKFDRSNIDKKLESFMNFSKSMYNEMKGQLHLVNCGLAAVFDARRLERFSSYGFKLSVCITVVLLATYQAHRLDENYKYVTFAWLPRLRTDEDLAQTVDTGLVISLLALGIIMLLLNLYCLIAQVLMNTTLVIAQRKGCMHVVWDPATWLRLAFLGSTVCGLFLGSYTDIMWFTQNPPRHERNFVHPQFVPGDDDNEDTWRPSRPMHTSFGYILYGFQMFDVFNHNEKAQYVLMAIKLPMGQIVATIFILVIVGYFLTALVFVGFRSELVSSNQCDSFRTCFLTVINYGPRLSGGIGDFLSPHLRQVFSLYLSL